MSTNTNNNKADELIKEMVEHPDKDVLDYLSKADRPQFLVEQQKYCLPEAPAFPAEFLDAMKDTAFQTMQDFLKKIDAPKEALELIDDLSILTTIGNTENGSQVSSVINQVLLETVASASRNIVQLGGVFYSPSGTTISREAGATLEQASE